jgi:hypothetical protein
MEVAGLLHLYLEKINKIAEENDESNFYDCLYELLDNNPDILNKYGFKDFSFQIHELENVEFEE